MRAFGWLVIVVLVSVATSVATVFGMQHLRLLSPPAREAPLLPAKVGVPSLRGLSEADARENLKALGLVFLVGARKAEPGAAPGTVVVQSPAAGQAVDAHGVVSVELARESPKVPSVVNRTLAEATALLAQAGYKLEQGTGVADANVPKGNVASQRPPADAGQETDKPVTVQLSTGPAEVDVPKLVGLGVEKAKARAKELGFELKINWVAQGETPSLMVLSQNPIGGKKLKVGEIVTITVNH
ncbi:MAG TPA: PASTA domain-containing protein [Polyangiaceae bacterium]|nr:PASTA domain-containing protein [Polyangiaceae bacterium]